MAEGDLTLEDDLTLEGGRTPEDLRAEYRAIMMNLMMITAANNSGYATLIPSGRQAQLPRNMLDSDSDDRISQNLLMSSLAAVLVRHSGEVVAVARVGQSEEFLATSFVAFTNASKTGSYFPKGSKHVVRLVESGQPRWTAISQLQTPDILDPNKL